MYFRQEIKANEEPFEKERALVSTLIVYCQKLMPMANDNSEDPSELNQDNKNNHVEPAPANCTVYRKNDGNDFLFAGVTKKSGGKSKNAKKLKVLIKLLQNDLAENIEFLYHFRHVISSIIQKLTYSLTV